MPKFTPIEEIIVEDRIRQDIKDKHINELAESIGRLGLLHPLVLSWNSERKQLQLVAGGCRLRAIEKLHEDGALFTFDQEICPPNEVPYVLLEDLTPTQLVEAELEENLIRAPLSWQEQTNALAFIHGAKKAENPKQTGLQTAEEIIEKSGQEANPGALRDKILRAEIIRQHLDDPEVATAKTEKDAWRVVHRKQTAILQGELSRRRQEEKKDASPHTLIKGDLREQMAEFADSSFDLILTDPPYGYNADKFTRQVKAGHQYDDSPEYAKEISRVIISEGFRVCKPRANAFIFCHHDMFLELREYSKQQGWEPWPRPIIWEKSREGFRPWGVKGFAYTYEMILFLTKGERGLRKTTYEVLRYAKVSDKYHGAEKPVDLLFHLIEHAAHAGDTILDPCCGSGSIFPAATLAKCFATGIELNDHYYDLASARMLDKPVDTRKGEEEKADLELEDL